MDTPKADIEDDFPESLEGRLLVAMPAMGDTRFQNSLIYMCAHGSEGAMGLIVNKHAKDISFTDLLDQLEISGDAGAGTRAVHIGGPVEVGRGFVLHSPDYQIDDVTREVADGVCLTATLDILRDMASGDGPRRSILALGYSGWAPGQLENEIRHNGWLACDADDDLIFGLGEESKWADALRKIGVDPSLLSAEGGRA